MRQHSLRFLQCLKQNQTEDPKTGALAPWKGIHAEEGKQAGMGNELDLIGNPKQQ